MNYIEFALVSCIVGVIAIIIISAIQTNIINKELDSDSQQSEVKK